MTEEPPSADSRSIPRSVKSGIPVDTLVTESVLRKGFIPDEILDEVVAELENLLSDPSYDFAYDRQKIELFVEYWQDDDD